MINFTEKSLLERRKKDLETLAQLRVKNNTPINYQHKNYFLYYYSMTLVGIVNGDIEEAHKSFCDFVKIFGWSLEKDNQVRYYRERIKNDVMHDNYCKLRTEFIINNLSISKKEQTNLDLLIGADEILRRYKLKHNSSINNQKSDDSDAKENIDESESLTDSMKKFRDEAVREKEKQTQQDLDDPFADFGETISIDDLENDTLKLSDELPF